MKIVRFFTNKYFLTTVGFVVLLLFFDQNDLISQREKAQELQEAKDKIAFLESEIQRMDKDYRALMSDPQKLEAYAREHYRMKRDSEDLYIVEKK